MDVAHPPDLDRVTVLRSRPGRRDPGDAGDPRRRGERRQGGAPARRGRRRGRRARGPAGVLRLALPVERVGAGVGLVRRLGRALGADVAELGRRPGSAGRRARGGLPRARHPRGDRRQRARVRAARARSTTRCCCSARTGCCTSTASSCRPSTSGSSTASAPATTCRSSTRPPGRVGGLICWENRMPLARYALYRQGPQIWVGADGRRLRRLGRAHAGDRDRVRRVRRRRRRSSSRAPPSRPTSRSSCPTATSSAAAAP